MSDDCNGNPSITLEVNDPLASRTVKPLRAVKPCTLPIVAVLPDGSVLSEKTGQILPWIRYAAGMRTMPRHIVVTFSPEVWLLRLNDLWKHDPRWMWKVTVQRKPNRKEQHHVGYYGFRPTGRKVPYANLLLDAGTFTNDPDADLIALGMWVREFCNTYGLQLRASAAGIASQLLRHPMFYPEARRAVPKFINDTARAHLPGPHYESYVETAQRMEAALYIDQEAAYHYAATVTPLPNANSVRACGLSRSNGKYARGGGELYRRELRKHGLIHVRAEVPRLSPRDQKYVPRFMRRVGVYNVWIWTNELPYLESFGLRVLHLISVWGTEETDTHIIQYARWAAELGRENPHLKALLLMPYGSLGRRPDTLELHTPGGTDSLLLAGQWVEGTRKRKIDVHTYTSNALQLGLIQSHVRALSLDMARQLSARGREVISIYADGIFIRLDDSGTVPMFTPWRLKEDNLEVHLTESLRVPVRAAVRREYLQMQTER